MSARSSGARCRVKGSALSSTDALPFLLVHGEWLWKAALAGFVALVLVAYWSLRRLLEGRAWRRELAARAARTAPDEIAGVLVGGLGESARPSEPSARRGDRVLARSLRAVPWAEARREGRADWRADAVYLRTDDGREIELEGALRVLGGSRVTAARGGVPRQLSDAELEHARLEAPWLHRWRLRASDVRTATLTSVRVGDVVVARGVLERAPGDGESDFRSVDVAWRMRGPGAPPAAATDDATDATTAAAAAEAAPPADRSAPIELRAQRPVTPRIRPSLFVLALLLGGAAFGGYSVEKQLGETWSDACYTVSMRPLGDEPVAQTPARLGDDHPCVKATASPRHRAYALERVLTVLESHRHRDEASLRRLQQLTYLVRGCAAVTERLMGLQRYEDAAASARQCGDRRDEHLALIAQGRYEEASALPVPYEDSERPALPTATTLIAAGRWREAAVAVEARAAALRDAPAAPDTDPKADADAVELTALNYQCLGLLLRHHGGDPKAASELRTLRAAPLGASCAPMLAELDGVSAQRTTVAEDEPHLRETDELLERQAYAAGVAADLPRAVPGEGPEETLAGPGVNFMSSPWSLWLATTSPGEELALSDERRVTRLRWRAVHQVIGEDLEGARQRARAALALASSARGAPEGRDCPGAHCGLRHLLPAIALYTPATELGADLTDPGADEATSWRRIWLFSFGRLLLRQGEPIDGAYFGPSEELPPALADAQRGDGRALARFMAGNRYGPRWWTDSDILAVLPRVTIARDEIAHQLRWSIPIGSRNRSIPGAALYAFSRREVMKAAGLHAEAARWDAIVRRLDAVLGDRRRLTALMFYEL